MARQAAPTATLSLSHTPARDPSSSSFGEPDVDEHEQGGTFSPDAPLAGDVERDLVDECVENYLAAVEADPVRAGETLRAILVACIEECRAHERAAELAREQHDSAIADLAVIHRHATRGDAPAAYWLQRLDHEREMSRMRGERDRALELAHEALSLLDTDEQTGDHE